MVKRGAGWFDSEYAQDEELYIVENAARDAGIGLRALPPEKRIEPCVWRGLRSESVTPLSPTGGFHIMHPLINVRAKVRRSIDHLETLDREITAFLSRDPYEVVTNFDPQKRAYSYHAKAREDVPVFIRILTGEVVTQLRSALDHLAWQLALLSGPNPRANTEFPIFSDATRYGQERAKKIGDLPAAAQTIIDGLQPYQSPQPTEHLLWILHRLANVDKHRLLTVVGAMLQDFGVTRRGRDMRIGMRLGPFDDQTEIGRVTFLNPAETDMEMKPSFTFQLAFPVEVSTQVRLVVPTLVAFGQTVEAVAEKLDHFFAPL